MRARRGRRCAGASAAVRILRRYVGSTGLPSLGGDTSDPHDPGCGISVDPLRAPKLGVCLEFFVRSMPRPRVATGASGLAVDNFASRHPARHKMDAMTDPVRTIAERVRTRVLREGLDL